jgi:ubiquinone biosynthesis protein UbiJ
METVVENAAHKELADRVADLERQVDRLTDLVEGLAKRLPG